MTVVGDFSFVTLGNQGIKTADIVINLEAIDGKDKDDYRRDGCPEDFSGTLPSTAGPLV
jgi:hypothetical protein